MVGLKPGARVVYIPRKPRMKKLKAKQGIIKK
jgi:hypothetical protein